MLIHLFVLLLLIVPVSVVVAGVVFLHLTAHLEYRKIKKELKRQKNEKS